MEIGTDLGMEGIAEDGGVGRTLSEIHRRSVSNSLLQCYRSVALLVFKEYSPRKIFSVRTVVDLFLDHRRQSKIVFFYAGFSPALEVHKSVIFLHFH